MHGIGTMTEEIKSNLNRNASVLNELTYGEVDDMQSDINKLFPTFKARQKAVANHGGVRLLKVEPELWTFKIHSGTKKSVWYQANVKFLDMNGEIKRLVPDKDLWKQDGSSVDLKKLAAKILYEADVQIYCSCLVGSTRIPLLDGRTLTLEEIHKEFGLDKEFWLYASDKNGDPTPARAKCLGITGSVKNTFKVTLDNDEIIECTGNHPFRMRDGSYKEAQQLQPGESLMPLYLTMQKPNRKYSQPYFKVKLNSKKGTDGRPIWKMVHRIVAETLLQNQLAVKKEQVVEKHYVVHHEDTNSLNNVPENLKWKGKLEHWFLHAMHTKDNCIEGTKKAWQDPIFRAERTEANRKAGKAFHEKHPEAFSVVNQAGVAFMKSSQGRLMASNLMKQTWEKNKSKMIEGIKQRIVSEETKQAMREGAARRWARPEEIQHARALTTERNKTAPRDMVTGKFLSFHNHKVLRVEKIQYDAPVNVYDLSVEGAQNFALDAGVFVHNCPAFLYWGSAYILTQADAKYTDPETREPNIRNPDQYGCMCKHADLLWEVLPTYITTMAKYLDKYFMGTIGGAEEDVLKKERGKEPPKEPEKGPEKVKPAPTRPASNAKQGKINKEAEKPPKGSIKGVPRATGDEFLHTGPTEGRVEPFERPGDQLFVWRANKQGGQRMGNRQIVRKIDFDTFRKEVFPRTRREYYHGDTAMDQYEDFLQREPNTVISYVDAGRGFEVSKIDNEDNIIGALQRGMKRGWVKEVDSWADGEEFRKVADSDADEAIYHTEAQDINERVFSAGAYLNA